MQFAGSGARVSSTLLLSRGYGCFFSGTFSHTQQALSVDPGLPDEKQASSLPAAMRGKMREIWRRNGHKPSCTAARASPLSDARRITKRLFFGVPVFFPGGPVLARSMSCSHGPRKSFGFFMHEVADSTVTFTLLKVPVRPIIMSDVFVICQTAVRHRSGSIDR